MWVATQHGFYSVVQHRKKHKKVLVRCRVRADADFVADFANVDVMYDAKADYPWRVVMLKDAWARFVARESFDIDYDNFKGRIDEIDHDRELIYMRVWQVLQGLERLDEWPPSPRPWTLPDGRVAR